MVEEGKPAPEFELTSDAGERVTVNASRTPVVLDFSAEQSTFLIDRDGRVARVLRSVKPDTPAGVLAALGA